MTTIIRRTAFDGDPALPRVPIGLPGVLPMRRASVLSFQGGDGEQVKVLSDAVTGRPLTNGAGSSPVFRLLPNGVPVFEFAFDPAGIGSAGNPTLNDSFSAAAIKTIVVVGRIVAQANAGSGGSANLQITCGAAGGLQGMSTSNYAARPGIPALQGYGDSGAVGLSTSPVAIGGPLQFLAIVFNDSSSIIKRDGESTTVTLGPATKNSTFTIGNSKTSGGTFQVAEVCHYATPLSVAQLEDLRSHMRAIYQF